MASYTVSSSWWQVALRQQGMQGMDKLLPPNATWDDVLASGRADLQQALELAQLKPNPAETVLEIGCGVGRVSQALGEHFGRVVGLDVSPALLEEARRRNTAPHVQFELVDGLSLQPESIHEADVIFSYEVLYLLRPKILCRYFADAFRLLKPNGQFVFQMNLSPLTLRTRVSYAVRRALYLLGVPCWRGWPTSPEVRRYGYERRWVGQQLAAVGFRVVRVAGPDLKQTWFVARKPE